MSAFADLQQAGASQDTDELAIVRGESTLRQTVGRVKGSSTGPSRPSVIDFAADQTIADDAGSGNTYNFTGAAGVTLTLPKASTVAAVTNGWEIVVRNSGTDSLEIAKQGLDTIDGDNTLTLYAGNSVRLQKTANRAWVTISVDQEARLAAGRAENTANSALNDATVNAAQINAAQQDATRALNDSAAARAVADSKISPPTVVIASADTAIPAAARGATYVHTGSSNITYTLPAASGQDAVPNGWEIVISNQGAGDLTIDGHGADTVDGEATLVITERGRSVRLQKLSNTVWATIADTKDETGSAENLPTVVNVAADTAIPDTAYGDTYRVTGNTARTITLPDPGDVPLGWFVRIANGSPAGVSHSIAREGAGQTIEGGNGPLAVPSGEAVTLQKVNANEWELIADTASTTAASGGALSLATALTDAQKKAWRAHFGSWHLDVTDNSTLPAIANYNGPDGILLGQGGDTTVAFADISDRSTMLTAGVAGDLMLLLGRGWVRVGNLFTGGAAVAAVRALAEAAQRDTDTVIEVGPDLVRGDVTPRNLNISIRHPLNAYPAANQLFCRVAGQVLARLGYDPNTLQQDVDAEVSAAALQNIWDQTVEIDDGAGGTRSVPRYPAGSYVPVEVRLDGPPESGAQRVTHFIRVVDVLVVDPASVPKTRFEQTVGASASAGNVKAGAYELEILADLGTNADQTRRVPKRILLSSLGASALKVWFRAEGPNQIAVSLSYVAATRTLTYSTSGKNPNRANLVSIKAIGEE